MKKRIAAVLLALAALLPGCARQSSIPTAEPKIDMERVAEGSELFALTDSQEEAEKIAELYGIELVDFSYGVATFHTEEMPDAVIQRGKDHSWPEIEINYVQQIN